ncbi:MAG: hypothetical protein K1W38_19140 [Lachnospiraceae bacterium]
MIFLRAALGMEVLENKRVYEDQIGCMLRQAYENAKIRNENEFRERLNYVLSDSEKI